MSLNSELILEQISNAGNSTVETVIGDPAKGDGFYGRSDGIHTVQYSITNFVGTIAIQATLSSEPADEDWFSVYEATYPEDTNIDPATTSKITNFTGNYVWIRAVVEYSAGTVNRILLNH